MTHCRPRFEPAIIPLIGADLLERPSPGKPGPIPALYHRSSSPARTLLVYVPGGVSSAPLAGHCDYDTLARQLDEVGYSLLIVQAFAAQRPAFIRFSTCLDDIQAVLAWAGQQGFTNISLAGSGLGATRAAYWAANQSGKVASLLLLSVFDSPHLALLRCGSAGQKEERDRLLTVCRTLVASGRGQEVVEVIDPPAYPGGRRAMSAEVVLDYFGLPEEASTTLVSFAERIRLPVCVINGKEDLAALAAGAIAVYESLVNAPRKEIFWVTEGHHPHRCQYGRTPRGILERCVTGLLHQGCNIHECC